MAVPKPFQEVDAIKNNVMRGPSKQDICWVGLLYEFANQ